MCVVFPYIILHMFCIVALILATQVISAVNEVEDQPPTYGSGNEYNDANTYRSMALFLVYVSSAAVIFQILLITIRCCCLMITSIMEKVFMFYALIVSSCMH